jgi:glycosyltransferase involved in cell wall biosynthesis
LRREKFDIVVDGINGVPFFTPIFVRKPKVAIMHHIVGKKIFFKELPLPLAIVGWIAERLIPFIYRRIPLIAVSPSTKDELIASGIAANRIGIVYNAIEQHDQGAIKKSEKPLVVYLGRIKTYKQLDHLLYAFAEVILSIPKVELNIAGRGECTDLERLAESLGVKQSVKFIGEVSEEQKIEILKRAWVFVTPSMKEGWGVSVIEANYFMTPAIAYDVPGLRDSINDGVTGLLVPPGNIEGLAKAIVRVLNDSKLRGRLSQNARGWAAGFSWDSSAKEFERVLEGVISGRRTTGVGDNTN